MGFMDFFKNLFGGKSDDQTTETPQENASQEAPTEVAEEEGESREQMQ